MSFATLIRDARLARRMDVAAMAKLLAITPGELALIESGGTFPPASRRRAWAAVLGFVDLLDFDRCWRAPLGGSTAAARATPDGFIPVVNSAPAGPPVDYQEFGIDTSIGCDYVPRANTPEQQSAEFLFAVIVVGDSMSPAFEDGDLVIFRPLGADETLADGAAMFVRFAANRDHTCTFKRIYRVEGAPDELGIRYELRPDNPAHAILCVRAEEIDRMAIAIERRAGYARGAAMGMRRVADQYAQG